MSNKAHSTSVVIEWSPGAVAAYDSATDRTIQGTSIADVASKMNMREAVLAVGRRACFVRSVTVPDAPKDELVQALTLSIGQYVPIGAGDACVDLRIIGNADSQGRQATLVAMRATDLRTMQEEAKSAGIRIIATVPAAYGSWILANGTAVHDCAAVSENAEGLGVDLISGGELRYSRALPPNSSNGQLAPELARTFSAAGMTTSPTFAVGTSVPSAEFRVEKSPIEALSGTGWAVPGVEFELPEVVQARAKAAATKRTRLAFLACAGAALFLTYVFMDRADAQAVVSKQQRKYSKELTSMRNKRDSEQLAANDAANMAKALDRAFKPAQTLGDILALASNDLPKNAWLTNVGVSRGQVVSIRGTAMTGADVKTYLDTLNAEERLRDVKLIFANNATIETTPIVQFSITAFPVGNLPLVDKPTKGGAKR